jgi:hypothetical protein
MELFLPGLTRVADRSSTVTLDAGLKWVCLWQTRCLFNNCVQFFRPKKIKSSPHCAIKIYCRRVRLHSDPQLLGILKHIKVEVVYQRAWTEHQVMALDSRTRRSGELGGSRQKLELEESTRVEDAGLTTM